jgi:outer membrane receptor protein involved in Fe transport
MRITRWITRLVGVVAAVGVTAVAATTHAQGVTTGAVAGRVTDTNGQPVSEAQVQVVNRQTGFSFGALSRTDGRYSVFGLEVGAYDVSVRRIGFQPNVVRGVRVSLSQTTPLDFQLETQAATLSTVTVEAEAGTGAIITPSRTGAATTVSDSALRRLPTLNRNFTDFVRLTPQVSSSGPGQSGGGTNNRFNNIQIDGATEADLFGLGSSGQPGGQAGGKSIGLESVKEYQVLLSPYDVRQGNFSGALINAVTKSGANDFFGSIYGFGRSDAFTRSQDYITEFEQTQYGFSAGGPIVKDRVLFFVNPEFQTRTAPAAGNYVGRTGFNTVSQADVDRFVTELEERGLSQLGGAQQVTIENPLTNVFGRLDFNFGRTQAVLRHNYGHAEDDVFSRQSGSSLSSFPLSNNGYKFTSAKNATVLQLRTQFMGGSFNEFIAGYTTIRDKRAYLGPAQPQVEVSVGSEVLAAGAERSSQANQLDQDIFELTNNFTLPLGAHRLTVGTQNQFFKVRNLFGQNLFGRFRFSSFADLEAGRPLEYLVGQPQVGDGSVRFSSVQYAAYLQDEYQATENLRLTLGLRADVPTLSDRPPYNPGVDSAFGRRTDEVPTGNVQWSPRFGFNWDVTGDKRNQLRGGAGMFTGRPAFVWLSNAFQNSGLSGYAQLVCPAATAPQFTSANVAAPPTQCTNGATARAGSEINLLREDLKFPQNFRGTLGYDRDLGMGLVATFEGIYTRGVNNLFYENIALSRQEGIGTGAHGRVVYGNAPGAPAVVAGQTRNRVLDVTNQSKDYSYSLTGGLTRRFQDNWEASAFYTYGRSFDVQSLTSSTAGSQYQFGRTLSGAHSNLELTPSRWDQPHRIVASGTYSFPTRTDVSFIYVGESGGRYDYVAQRDLNGDGFESNDLAYVPTDATNASEITFTNVVSGGVTYTPAQQAEALERFIQGTECLRENRGRILPRLSCREPFTNRVDVSVRQSLPTFRGQSFTLALDVINFGNLLNKEWGLQPLTTGTPVRLYSSSNTLVGGNLTAGGQPLFQFDPNQQRFDAGRLSSNYQMQASIRYSF